MENKIKYNLLIVKTFFQKLLIKMQVNITKISIFFFAVVFCLFIPYTQINAQKCDINENISA